MCGGHPPTHLIVPGVPSHRLVPIIQLLNTLNARTIITNSGSRCQDSYLIPPLCQISLFLVEMVLLSFQRVLVLEVGVPGRLGCRLAALWIA